MVCGAVIQLLLKSVFTFLFIHLIVQSYLYYTCNEDQLVCNGDFCQVQLGFRVYKAVNCDIGTYLAL